MRFFKKKVFGWKCPRDVDNCRNSSPDTKSFILSKYWQHPVQHNQYLERGGHHRPPLSPPINTNKTSGIPHQSDFQKQIIYQYTVHASIQTNPKVIRRKHTAYPTGFDTYSYIRYTYACIEIEQNQTQFHVWNVLPSKHKSVEYYSYVDLAWPKIENMLQSSQPISQ